MMANARRNKGAQNAQFQKTMKPFLSDDSSQSTKITLVDKDRIISDLKISFLEYSFIMNKHDQKLTDMFNKQDVTVYFIY